MPSAGESSENRTRIQSTSGWSGRSRPFETVARLRALIDVDVRPVEAQLEPAQVALHPATQKERRVVGKVLVFRRPRRGIFRPHLRSLDA